MIIDNKSDWDASSNNMILNQVDDEIFGNSEYNKFRFKLSK